MQHFGHFIIETITTLWPQEQVTGLVFHRYLKRPWNVDAWQSRLLELTGYGGLPIRVVDRRRPLKVERLIVPSRTIVANGWGHPEATAVWQRIASGVQSVDRGGYLYLSRTQFNEHRARPGKSKRSHLSRDTALDEAFASAGFHVVAPETLSIDQQIALVSSADLIAGASGSALHLSAFAAQPARVLELGDMRSLAQPIAMQLVVDALRGHKHAFIRGDATVREVARRLAHLSG